MDSEFTLHFGKCYYVHISFSSVSLTSLSRLIMFLVQHTPVFMISFGLAPLYDLIDMISFRLPPSICLYQWKFSQLTSTPLLQTLWFPESPILQHLNAPLCKQLSQLFQHFKSYYSMTWYLCAILLLTSYTGNLYLRIEVKRIS